MSAGTAFIIETRAHSALPLVIENIHQHIPPNWGIYVFHGSNTAGWLRSNLSDSVLARTRFINLQIQTLTLQQYSHIMSQETFWEQFPTNKVLSFQTDTIINANSPHKLDDFMEYDYVGAPWSDAVRKKFDFLPDVGGNGGFCLSSRDKRIEILNQSKLPKNYSEDIWFSKQLIEFGAKLPSKVIAKHFCVESMFYEFPFAVHKPWETLSPKQYAKLEKNVPLLDIIRHARVLPELYYLP